MACLFLNHLFTLTIKQMKQLFRLSYPKLFLASVTLMALVGDFSLSSAKLTAYATEFNYCKPSPRDNCQSGATGICYENYKLVIEQETFE